MFRRRTVLRMIGWAIVCLCGALLVSSATVRLSQYVFRRRAERLLEDLRLLELRKSTYADAHKVIARWGDDVYQTGACQRYRCDIEITLRAFTFRNPGFWIEHQGLLEVYRRLGGRPGGISASIGVRDGLVWSKGVRTEIERTLQDPDTGKRWEIGLIGSAFTRSPDVISALHPEYRVGVPSGCTACKAIYVTFTPFADPADINRLMVPDLSCFTRWKPCETQADIFPAAWQETQSHRSLAEGELCGPEVVRTLGREAWRVAVGTVTKTIGTEGDVSIRWDEDLKNRDSNVPQRQSIFAEPRPAKAKRGERYLVFFASAAGDTYYGCPLVPGTAENVRVAEKGISEDWSDDRREVALPFLYQDPRIKPPTIEMKEE